ncbi:AMP-binding protein [Methylobrevis pamukkalensis]|uniref:3-methylmercaptopropionyl-CoA ligase n=1 Tax=Methylobrevis pamukkalensis TaxID=1439726 RepID=A0A1E3H1X5_9HYPH|nr:AMP-binding protein [Methylobrevis pamukkalensis]ODN70339.1 Long-chain-fatty-acid--CoA ligase [Methylobrevis pamukkalensis]
MLSTEDEAAAAYAARPWLARYPDGVPAEIAPAGPVTLPAMMDEVFRRHAAHDAVESFGVRRTYAEVERSARAVTAWLQAEGLRPGDRVAIMMPNVMAFLPVLFGTLAAGCTVVNVNPLYTARELAAVLDDSGARVLFALENFGTTVETALTGRPLHRLVLVAPGDLLGLKGHLINAVSRHVKKNVPAFRLPEAVRLSTVLRPRAAPEPVAIAPDDIAFLQYTGGTTGLAKGAMLTHRNVAANVLQVEAWIGPFLDPAERHVTITALPLYHIFALTCSALVMVRIGACQVLIANPRDVPTLIAALKRRRFSAILVINTLARALLQNPDFRTVDFSGLKLAVAGGMAVQSSVAREWQATTGRPIVEGYGLSETSPVVCANRPDIAAFTGTIGYPLPSTDISIRDIDGKPVATGERGELCVRGPQVMAGYWRQPEETARAMTADGYFRTGDVAVMDESGRVAIVDRLKDMVIVSGFNVYPNEVEDVIASHPAVAEVAVVGRRDERAGEAVVAYVVRRPGSDIDAEALRAHCRTGLTAYKVPREIRFVDALPKTNVGKIMRVALREDAARPQSRAGT